MAIFELPEGLQGIGYLEGIELYFWYAVIVLFFVGSILFLNRARNVEMKSQKMSFVAFAVFGFCMGLCRIFFILGVFYNQSYDDFTVLGYISALVGLIFWVFVLEKYLIQKTKNVLSIVLLVAFSFTLVALAGLTDRYTALNIQYALLPVILVSILAMYIYLIMKTTGTIRIKVIGILVGLLLILAGQMLDAELIISTFPQLPFIVAPSIMIAGIILFLSTQLYYK